MHCKVCDALLTEFEATRKDANTMRFLDMCNVCIAAGHINTIDRLDLMSDDDVGCFDIDIDDWK